MVIIRYTKEKLIRIAKAKRDHFTSASKWNHMAVQFGFPQARTYAYYFGSWNKAKEVIFENELILNQQFTATHTEEQLKCTARTHALDFTTALGWNEYAQEKGLPLAGVYIHKYNSWENAKNEIFGIDKAKKKALIKENLSRLAKKNKMHFTTGREWNDFARERNYPSVKIYCTYFGTWKQAKNEILGDEAPISISAINKNRYLYTKDDLMIIGESHQEYFKSMKIWNDFARSRKLPWAGTFASYFGSWNEAKREIFGVENTKFKDK
ncbi:hypothetical protein [Lederbergia lenta]|uniref:hypothetical protein n=1 Tax=Lederbergia lenta TaxID=1467 RepID=UPI00203B78F3|nr:hypothetical protein [Lederbergia lenta]MCM3113611.1 hypothetical protein [Lederbergia lenta]